MTHKADSFLHLTFTRIRHVPWAAGIAELAIISSLKLVGKMGKQLHAAGTPRDLGPGHAGDRGGHGPVCLESSLMETLRWVSKGEVTFSRQLHEGEKEWCVPRGPAQPVLGRSCGLFQWGWTCESWRSQEVTGKKPVLRHLEV